MNPVLIFADPVQAVFHKQLDRILRPATFATWLAAFSRAINRPGDQIGVCLHDAKFPEAVAQRRMIHRVALSLARVHHGAVWPLGAGLAPLPPGPATDSLGSPLAPGLGLGALAARAVLVGDRPQPGAARWADRLGWPFISALNTGCSAWLAEQLEDAGIPEDDLRWVNGWTNEGKINVEALQHAVFHTKTVEVVVAMGRNAAKALDAIGYVPYREVHHPQHWKHFHHRAPYQLKKILRRALS